MFPFRVCLLFGYGNVGLQVRFSNMGNHNSGLLQIQNIILEGEGRGISNADQFGKSLGEGVSGDPDAAVEVTVFFLRFPRSGNAVRL